MKNKVIKSVLDNDLYKFSMSYSYLKMYPDAEGVFEFKDRNHTKYTEEFITNLKEAFNEMSSLCMDDSEFNWVVKNIKYIPRFFWEWYKGFRFEPNLIKVWLDENSELHITVEDKMYKVTFYEVPILACVSEVYHRMYDSEVNLEEVISRLDEKILLSNENGLKFADFGTRRRESFDVQETVVKRLKDSSKYCTGTSNVFLAYKYNMKPIGTFAHEMVMFHAAMFGYRMANYLTLEAWVSTYDGDLGIALVDTLTTNIFLKNFSKKHAHLFDGVRQDSGDEFEFVDKVLARYKELGIDPTTKTIVFSNALDMPKFKRVEEYCRGKIRCSAGIGTNLTCDTGHKPMNIVMKLMKCRMNDKQDWVNCIKLSDDLGKHMGDEKEVKLAIETLGLKED